MTRSLRFAGELLVVCAILAVLSLALMSVQQPIDRVAADSIYAREHAKRFGAQP
jgi:Tfp pilus assembly protein FimT